MQFKMPHLKQNPAITQQSFNTTFPEQGKSIAVQLPEVKLAMPQSTFVHKIIRIIIVPPVLFLKSLEALIWWTRFGQIKVEGNFSQSKQGYQRFQQGAIILDEWIGKFVFSWRPSLESDITCLRAISKNIDICSNCTISSNVYSDQGLVYILRTNASDEHYEHI